MHAMLAVAPGLIAVGTVRFGGDLSVAIEVHEMEPAGSFDSWDQVALGSIDVPSGCLVVSAPEMTGHPDNPHISVPPGTYRALVYWGNLDSVKDEMDMHGEDHYQVALWPGTSTEPIILKQRGM